MFLRARMSKTVVKIPELWNSELRIMNSIYRNFVFCVEKKHSLIFETLKATFWNIKNDILKHCKVCSFLLLENELTGHVGVVSSRYNFLVLSFYKHFLRSSKLTHNNWARLVLPFEHDWIETGKSHFTLNRYAVIRPPIFFFALALSFLTLLPWI